MNISSPNFKKIQNNHNLLKFHLSEKCKILNNSQLYKFYHINILNGDIFHLEWSIITKSLNSYSLLFFKRPVDQIDQVDQVDQLDQVDQVYIR